MDIVQIRTLLERYFEGQTTLQEEQALLDYFTAESPDPELHTYQQQFMMLHATREQKPGNPDFETRLAGMIDDQQQIPSREVRLRLVYRMAAAATIAVLIGVSGLLVMYNRWHRAQDTYSDPQLAYVETRKALLYVSQKMNRGIKPLSAVSKINAGTKPLKSLNKLDNSLDMLYVFSIINNSSNLKK